MVGGVGEATDDVVTVGEFMPHMLQRSEDLVLNDCDSPRRLHSRPMASLAPSPLGTLPG